MLKHQGKSKTLTDSKTRIFRGVQLNRYKKKVALYFNPGMKVKTSISRYHFIVSGRVIKLLQISPKREANMLKNSPHSFTIKQEMDLLKHVKSYCTWIIKKL